MSLKCYSDCQLGAIKNDITPLTLRFTEDSAKQLVITLLFTGISMIRLIGEMGMYFMFRLHIPRC